MAKPFNIHDWQAKQKLAEAKDHKISKEEMKQLHQTGKVKLKDGTMLAFMKEDELAENETPKGESMSNADIRALQTIISNYNLNKILNTLAVIVDRTGKHDEAEMIKKLTNQMNEMNTTGTGASFQAGNSAAYATPKAFKKKRKDRMDEVSYRDFKRNTESTPRQKIAKGISQVGRMIKEIEKIVNHNFRLKTELDMNSGTFMKSTNKRIHELGAQLKRLENKLREFSN